MDEYKVDFHIHTNYSDGQATPVEIVKKAKELEYDMIAITDHDGVEGIKEAMIAGETAELKVVPGIELSTETDEGTELHILGYYINPDEENLKKTLDDLREKRNTRNIKLIELLNSMGYQLSIDDLKKLQPNGFIGKPVIARALRDKGYIENPKDAFKDGQFLGSDEAKAIKKVKLKAADAIKLIKGAGGIAVLAHPIQIKGFGEKGSEEFYMKLDALVKNLKLMGLKGIECYHPDHGHDDTMHFIAIAEKYHLHITKGSDFHGKNFGDEENQ